MSPPHGGADRNAPDREPPLAAAVAPSRGRGSKPPSCRAVCGSVPSPPHGGADRNTSATSSCNPPTCRPLTGARIETAISQLGSTVNSGRPLTGARIETRPPGSFRGLPVVAPSRGRGSKLRLERVTMIAMRSPPHGGADRNAPRDFARVRDESRPLTGARIETAELPGGLRICAVAPSRGRGSKHFDADPRIAVPGRPLTGARIETPTC